MPAAPALQREDAASGRDGVRADLAVTTNLNINFLRKGRPGQDVLAAARLLKLGKRLAVGEVNLLSGTSPDPIAHVTSTYSIPNQ
jgi:acyl-coenzyme A thioesterase PaaI-like protein